MRAGQHANVTNARTLRAGWSARRARDRNGSRSRGGRVARGMTIMLEELKELGVDGVDYDLYKINIGAGDQFGSDFVKINPNSYRSQP